MTRTPGPAAPQAAGGGPANAGLVLASLIAVAAVANLNLSVANVALPSIGLAFDASQTQLDLVAVGYSLGLAGSVLWLGALGDRYGRKLMIMLGIGLAIPASLIAAFAPSDRGADPRPDRGRRVRRHGLPDDARPHRRPVVRSRAHALDRPVVGDRRCHRRLRPDRRGLPPRAVRVGLGVPRHAAARGRRPGRWPGGSSRRTSTNRASPSTTWVASCPSSWSGRSSSRSTSCPSPTRGRWRSGSLIVAVAALIAFVMRQRRAPNPLYDLHIASRRVFWVAACAGIIVFGSLMGAMFIGQQYLQNVLGYSTFEAGLSIIPAALFMILVAPRSARPRRGARSAVHAAHRATCSCSSAS